MNEVAIILCKKYLKSLQDMHSESVNEVEKKDLMMCILTTINIIEMLKGND